MKNAVALFLGLFVLFNIYCNPVLAQDSTIIRGPYLQTPTSESIVVCWRTMDSIPSKLMYGTAPDAMIDIIEMSKNNIDHAVKISGLSPNTKYYYTIFDGDEELTEIGENYIFKTAPIPGTPEAMRIWVLGDFGRGNELQKMVKDAYVDYTGDRHTDVWLWLGDNAYQVGSDQEYQDIVFSGEWGYQDILRKWPFWTTPGNHDYLSVDGYYTNPESTAGPYFDIVHMPTEGEAGGVPSGTELYYSFDHGNVHFISLNSEVTWILFEESVMMDWLRQDLAATTADWVVAFFHEPPYSKGSHDSDDAFEAFMTGMRENFLPTLEAYGVDLVLAGHSHVYERSAQIKGHYGLSSTLTDNNFVDDCNDWTNKKEPYYKRVYADDSLKGTIYVVCGNGGSQDEGAPLDHPIMCSTDDGIGSIVMDVKGDTLISRYLNGVGEIVDEFAIVREMYPVGMEDYDLEVKEMGDLLLYPNPTSQILYLRYYLSKNSAVDMEIYDLSGRLIYTESYKEAEGKHFHYYDLNQLQLSKGIYMVDLKCNGVRQLRELIGVY